MTGHHLRMASYASLWGMLLLFLASLHPRAELQPVLRVPQDYPTIQAAVDAAPEGATILIEPGTYTENIVITKSLTLEGSGISVTTLKPAPTPVTDPLSENSVLTVQAPERVVTLRVRRLTVTQSTGVRVLTRASLVFEQSAWVNLAVVISASSLKDLEVRDSLFEQDYAFIFVTHGGEFAIQNAIFEHNQFTKGITLSLYDRLALIGQYLVARNNTVTCDAKHSLPSLYPYSQSGIALGVIDDDGYVEIARNVVASCNNGIVTGQSASKARVIIRDNGLFNNNRNLILESFPEDKAYPQIDWLVEDNIIVGGGIGIRAFVHPLVKGGQVRLMGNQISWQHKQHLGISSPGDISYFGNGILLGASARREALEEPLKIEISENRIEHNEAWGLAFNLILGWDSQSDQCNVRAPGEEQVFIDPEITGSGNIFRNNGKGDLCPPDYPWPPGFRKP